MTASIDFLPVWKKDATPCERLQEIAEIARKYPERFQSMVIVYQEEEKDASRTRYTSFNCDTTLALGILEQAKEEIHVNTRGKRLV